MGTRAKRAKPAASVAKNALVSPLILKERIKRMTKAILLTKTAISTAGSTESWKSKLMSASFYCSFLSNLARLMKKLSELELITKRTSLRLVKAHVL